MTRQSASQQNKRNRRKKQQKKQKNKLTLDLDPITNNSVFHTAGVHREDGRQSITPTQMSAFVFICVSFPLSRYSGI